MARMFLKVYGIDGLGGAGKMRVASEAKLSFVCVICEVSEVVRESSVFSIKG